LNARYDTEPSGAMVTQPGFSVTIGQPST
jgi:hypothetical protein